MTAMGGGLGPRPEGAQDRRFFFTIWAEKIVEYM
jgi:hypothetical protein